VSIGKLIIVAAMKIHVKQKERKVRIEGEY